MLTGLMEELRSAQKQISELRSEVAKAQLPLLITKAETLPSGARLLTALVDSMDAKSLQVLPIIARAQCFIGNFVFVLCYQLSCSAMDGQVGVPCTRCLALRAKSHAWLSTSNYRVDIHSGDMHFNWSCGCEDETCVLCRNLHLRFRPAWVIQQQSF